MIRELFLGDFSLSSCVWQSTIFLVVGLVGSFILRHRSSRAHQVLFLAMIAAVIVPIMSILVKHYELGMFVAEPVVIQSPAKDLATASNYGASVIISAEDIEHNPGLIEKNSPPVMAGSEIAKFPWRSVVLYGWIAASLILVTRLLVTFVLGARLLGRALPLQCEKIEEALHLAKAKLGIDKDVMVRSSQGVRSPVIWCWRRRPVLLVPSAAGQLDNGVDWAGVLCHELAHWKRRDHISGLLAELVVCILPWHPLLWWAKSRLVRLSEQACDDWVVAIGQPSTDYAESLLDLTPVGQMAFVPAVVSSKRGLAYRIRRILKDSCGNPRAGTVWALAVSIVALCLAVGIAFAQTRPSQPTGTIKAPQKADTAVEDDIIIATSQAEESLAGNIPPDPVLATSPAPPDNDKAHVQVDCLIVEVSLDSKMDRETTIMAENLLGNKMSLRDTKVDVLLRKAAGATAATKDKSAGNKRVTQDQFKALTEMLTSRGYMRILMNPTIETVNGKKAIVKSSQHIPLQKITNYIYVGGEHIPQTHTEYKDVTDSLEITPHVFADGHIILQVEAAISSQFIPQGKEQTPIISRREVSTRVRISPGESRIIGMKRIEKGTEADSNAKDSQEQITEVLLILTPTIITPSADSQEKTDVRVKGKVSMEQQVYDISDLVVTAADANDLIRRITTTIEPDSWYKLSDTGEGTVIAYPIRQPKKFAVLQTRKIHQKIKRFLEDMHTSQSKQEKTKPAILIETRLLSVSEDFLKDIGLDAKSISSSNAWSEHLVADSAAEPNSEKYSLILDELNVRLLLKAVQAHQDSNMLAAPQVICQEGKTASIAILTEEYYVLGYTEPNRLSDEPESKKDKVEIGTRIWLKPELTPDNENVRLDFKLEIRQLLGYEERKYKGKYKYIVPRTEVVSTQTQLVVPDGKTLLIGGLKITEQVESRAGAPILSKLPLIGRLFRRSDKIKEQRLLLILVKLIINPQQKASKILRGEADSEEHIKFLARQLEKKLNPPAEQK